MQRRSLRVLLCILIGAQLGLVRTSAANDRVSGTLRADASTLIQRRQLIAYAHKHNRSLRLIHAQIKRVRAAFKGTGAFPNNPRLSAVGGAQFPSAPSTPSTAAALPRVGVNLSLAVPIGGRWGKSQAVARARLAWSQKLLSYRSFLLALRVHRQVNAVATAGLILRKHVAINAFFGELERLTRQRLKLGSATRFDLQLLRIARMRAQQAWLAAKLRHRVLRQQLKAALGWPTSKKGSWQVSLPSLPALPSKSAWLQRGLQTHTAVGLAQAAIERAQARLSLARARAVPDLTFSVGYAFEDQQHIVTGGVSMPLPLFWRNQSAVGARAMSVRQARMALARQRVLLRRQIERGHLQYASQLRAATLYQKQLSAMKKRTRMLNKGAAQGGVSVFQVLTTRRSLLQAELSYLRSIQRAHDSYIALCRAAGALPAYKGTFLLPSAKGK